MKCRDEMTNDPDTPYLKVRGTVLGVVVDDLRRCFCLAGDMRSVDRKQRLFGLSWAPTFNHQPRSTNALAVGLAVVRISIPDANDTAILLGLINVGAVYCMDTKAHCIPGLHRDCNGIG